MDKVACRVILLLVFLAAPLCAQNTLTWTGGGASDNWSDINNWGGVGTPDATNNILIFAGNTRLTTNNDIAGLTIRQIQLASGAGAFSLSGNDFTLGDVAGPATTMQFGTSNFTVNNNITLGRTQSWTDPDGTINYNAFNGSINFGSYNLTLGAAGQRFDIGFYGNISGTGNLYSNQFANTWFYNNTVSLAGVTTNFNNAWLHMGNNTWNGNITTTDLGNRFWQPAGNTTVVNGNISINGSFMSAFSTVQVQGLLDVTGNVFINVDQDWILSTLMDDFSGGIGGTNWGLFSLNGGNLTYGANADFRPTFSFGLDPNSGNPFWGSTRRWLVGELDTGSLTYTQAMIRNATWTNGYFFLDNIGNDLYLNWQLTPEPSTWAMLGVGVLLASLSLRRRRGSWTK